MTDATRAVTGSALEAFAREYLAGLGASVREEGPRWTVSLPTHVDAGFADDREFEVVVGDEPDDEGEERVLAPGSDFARRLLDEATEVAPVGRVALTADLVDSYRYPDWVAESDAEVADATFSPYYDRTGVCAFVRVGVETVSEYQTQFLRAVALDAESGDRLPGVAETLVAEWFEPTADPPLESAGESADAALSEEALADAIAAGRRAAVEDVRDEIAEIRRSASRAADAEFEEYRQLREQRLAELRDEVGSLTDRLRDLADEADGADSRQQRVEILEKRRELKDERERLEAELDEVRREKERGHERKRGEIYDRHAIEVTTTPVAATLVTYERGEMDLTLREGGRTGSVRAPYAVGAGVTDGVDCGVCGEPLSGENPVRVTADGVGCRRCR